MKAKIAKHQLFIDLRSEGRACMGHGDLRLEHIYVDEAQAGGERLLLVDCIKFNARFRYIDPIADIDFVMMELRFYQHQELAKRFVKIYIQTNHDSVGKVLLPLYIAYRAMVRAKVESIRVHESEVAPEQRKQAMDKNAKAGPIRLFRNQCSH